MKLPAFLRRGQKKPERPLSAMWEKAPSTPW